MTNDDTRPLVFFATYSERPGLTADDELFARALAGLGARVQPAVWDDAAVPWSSAAAVVIRSTWDYFRRRADFLNWADRVSRATMLHNESHVVRWNSHKRYLASIAERGVPVIDTVFADAGTSLDLDEIARVHGWGDVVVKPAVSAAANETRRFVFAERAEGQAHLDRLIATRDVMVQPHLSALAEQGELSLLFARGRFTHAVRRRSALVDGHVMPTSAATDAPAAAVRSAERVLEAAAALTGVAPNELLYSRVDLAPAVDDHLLLELELIEPSLFLGHAPHASKTYAEALLSFTDVRSL